MTNRKSSPCFLFCTGSPYTIVRDRQRNFYRLCADDTNFVGFNFGKFKKILTSEKYSGGHLPPLAGATDN